MSHAFTKQQSSVVLIGGQSTRMGTPKHQLVYAEKTLLSRLVDDLLPLTTQVFVSGQCSTSAIANTGAAIRIISDQLSGFQGPLAGIATALTHCQTPWLWVQSCDTLVLPSQLQGYMSIDTHSQPGIVCFGANKQPTFPLMGWYHVSLLPSLLAYLASGERRLMQFVNSQHPIIIDMPTALQARCNFNTPAEFAHACAVEQENRSPPV